MINNEAKLNLLKMNGFKHKSTGDLRFNRKTKKIFSDIAIQDHDIHWLREKIEEENTSGVMVYFNENIDTQKLEELRSIFDL